MVELRPADPLDAGATGDILWRFQNKTGWMPNLYSKAETVAFCGTMIDRNWVTVAVLGGVVTGFLARDRGFIHSLFVASEETGKGVGTALLNDAKGRSDVLDLKTFVANEGAQRFYLREGFVENGRGDGSDNDENLPDIAYRWRKARAEGER